MIAGNPGTVGMLAEACAVWAEHLADSEDNARPVKGRDGLGWGTPMTLEFRSVIKTVAFGFRPPGSRQVLMQRLSARSTPDLAREMTERFFGDFPELRSYTPVARAQVTRVRACADCGCVLALRLGGLEEHAPGCPRMPL